MQHPLMDAVENKYKRQNELEFEIGDTVAVRTLSECVNSVTALSGAVTFQTRPNGSVAPLGIV